MEGLLTRSLTEADRDLLAALASRVSPQSMISRFHGAVGSLSPSLLDRLLDLAPGQREALIALDDQVVVAVVRYARDTQEGDTAEVAALVADEWQHHGVGLELMRQLASRARAAGISRFRGDMLSGNAGAQRLMTALGQAVSRRRADGHTVMIIDLAPSVVGAGLMIACTKENPGVRQAAEDPSLASNGRDGSVRADADG